MQHATRTDEILEFWFGEIAPDGNVTEDRSALWWKKNDDTDAEIRRLFERDVQETLSGARDSWTEHPRGRLALIVTLDQFPRNIYRDRPEAFGCDDKARGFCLEGLKRGADRELSLIERVFYYLPLEHAEDRELQRRSVDLYGKLADEAPATLEKTFRAYQDYAVQHEAIVQRFGRFPHRNAILGRESTAEEQSFLQQPGSSF